jgi:hypothetical protein
MAVTKTRLQILRAADYVIPPCCCLCQHVSFYGADPKCTLLEDVTVHEFGHCKFFASCDERALLELDTEDKPLLERRAYTRSNRHKKGVRF